MSRSRTFLRYIEPDLPGLVLCRDMLVVRPTAHLVRGFLLERTAEKGRVYLWRVVAPLYRPMTEVILNYSDRIPERGEIWIENSAPQESIDAIREPILKNIKYLRDVESPSDFLRHANWIRGGSPILSRLDRALTLYLVGDHGHGAELLRALKAEADGLDPARAEYIAPVLEQAVQALGSAEGLTPLLEQWERQNVQRLDLEKSRLSAAI